MFWYTACSVNEQRQGKAGQTYPSLTARRREAGRSRQWVAQATQKMSSNDYCLKQGLGAEYACLHGADRNAHQCYSGTTLMSSVDAECNKDMKHGADDV